MVSRHLRFHTTRQTLLPHFFVTRIFTKKNFDHWVWKLQRVTVDCSGVSICKRFFDQMIIIRDCWDINSKILTIFLFPNFIHLPFFFVNPHLAPNLYIAVQLVLHLDYWWQWKKIKTHRFSYSLSYKKLVKIFCFYTRRLNDTKNIIF